MDVKISFSTVSDRTRIESLDKFLARNRDALLVKLDGHADESIVYKPGHVCGMKQDENGNCNVYVGSHMIGQLPDEAISYANEAGCLPELLDAIVGIVENDGIFIYIA